MAKKQKFLIGNDDLVGQIMVIVLLYCLHFFEACSVIPFVDSGIVDENTTVNMLQQIGAILAIEIVRPSTCTN